MKPGLGEVLLAEGDPRVREDEEKLIEEFRRQLDEGMWAAVPTTDSGSGRREAQMVKSYRDIPDGAIAVAWLTLLPAVAMAAPPAQTTHSKSSAPKAKHEATHAMKGVIKAVDEEIQTVPTEGRQLEPQADADGDDTDTTDGDADDTDADDADTDDTDAA